jgi:hypothetical protein
VIGLPCVNEVSPFFFTLQKPGQSASAPQVAVRRWA